MLNPRKEWFIILRSFSYDRFLDRDTCLRAYNICIWVRVIKNSKYEKLTICDFFRFEMSVTTRQYLRIKYKISNRFDLIYTYI